MKKPLIYLDPQSQVSLQGQLRQRFVNSIADGTYPGRSRLPSSRELAEQLHVARNTVVLAIGQLVDEGLLVSRPRSGIYVNEKVVEGRVGFEGATAPRKTKVARWRRRFKATPGGSERFRLRRTGVAIHTRSSMASSTRRRIPWPSGARPVAWRLPGGHPATSAATKVSPTTRC